ncbi:DUF739 family protein [Enterococcus sp. BWB1-3]|uniref:DUF739 family protein n=1 Tax=Enterococcus sp. BWB1-3 TaxID=2787713 RepID=UPI0019237A80|nr:DUF739 family protein [Enterococcus sp. BWB1-3]MBL1228193.1 DUF739 family protein [Enterococcus sp. BWB1-3]
MSFDYSKLLGRITEKYGTQYNFAVALGVSERTLSLKLNHKVRWKDSDIAKVLELLDLTVGDIPSYFFKEKVHKT